jgi:TolA-binding protein
MAKRKPVKAARPEKRRGAPKIRQRPARAVSSSPRQSPKASRPVTVERPKAPAIPSAPAVARPAAEALALFEQAVGALQHKRYSDSLARFQQLLERFPAERTVLDRARVYMDLCTREMARQPAAPKTIEERLMTATLALNNLNDAAAEQLARSVLSDAPDHDLAHYMLAVIAARRGQIDTALSALHAAVQTNPEARVQARLDDDFAALRSLERFQALTDPPPSAPLALRRARRTRNER